MDNTTKILEVVTTKSKVWVTINNITIGFDKINFIKLIENTESFLYAKELGKDLV